MSHAASSMDEHASTDADTNPLTLFDSERERVRAAVDEYIEEEAQQDSRGGGGDGEQAVPTEMLQEDLSGVLELPADYRELPFAAYVAARPKQVLMFIYGTALVSLLWILMTPGDRFNVDEDHVKAVFSAPVAPRDTA